MGDIGEIAGEERERKEEEMEEGGMEGGSEEGGWDREKRGKKRDTEFLANKISSKNSSKHHR